MLTALVEQPLPQQNPNSKTSSSKLIQLNQNSSSYPSHQNKMPHSKCIYSDVIQDYQVEKMIGKGAFGSVHIAKSLNKESFNKWVAIKMIDKKLMKAGKMSQRVANEVELHWQLHHHSILELYNYFEDSDYVYLVTELCEKGELFRFMRKHRPEKRFSETEAQYLMKQVVEGLKYLHSHYIVHRDLKLSNLLLTHGFQVKIADFGLAVRLDVKSGELRTLCGTPNYISPEVVQRQPYGLSSDIWSLGCMLVTMLTGSPPFESHGVQDTLHKVSKGDFSLPTYISPYAKHLILSLVQKDPTKRPSIDEILKHPFFRMSREIQENPNPFLINPLKPLEPCINSSSSVSIGNKESFKENNSMKEPRQSTIRKTSSSSSSFPVEELPSFNTKRLKTLKQNTKHGIVSILTDGRIFIHFHGDENDLLISADSDQISVVKGNTVQANFTRLQLPSMYHRKYRYVVKFVELVKSKTPKIIFYSPQAKCMLMENSPMPDFEMLFYNGTKVVHSSMKRRLVMIRQKEEVTIDMASSKKISLKPEFIPIFKHAQECLKQCMQMEKSALKNGDSQFPMILKSSQCHVPQKTIGNSNLNENGLNENELSAYAGTIKSLPSAHGSFHPSCASNFTTGPTLSNYPLQHQILTNNGTLSTSTATAVMASESQSTFSNIHMSQSANSINFNNNINYSNTLLPHRIRTAASNNMMSNSNQLPPLIPAPSSQNPSRKSSHSSLTSTQPSAQRHPQPELSISQNQKLQTSSLSSPKKTNRLVDINTPITNQGYKKSFLKDAGWCMKLLGEGEYILMFLDGICLTIESKKQILLLDDPQLPEPVLYSIDKKLPPHIKQKLAYFPKFIQSLSD